jgi:hypothetical protein
LLSFTATAVKDHVNLKWVTASEINNDYFTLERSKTGDSFEKLFNVPGAGNSNYVRYYSEEDKKPLKDLSYYRLKQTDYNGASSYSGIVAVFFGDDAESGIINYYVDDHNNLQVIFQSATDDLITLSVYDIKGMFVGALKEKCTKGLNNLMMDVSHYAAGIYLLKLNCSSSVFTNKFLIP